MAAPMPTLWLFLDVPEPHWQTGRNFWAAVTGTRLSPLRGENGQFATLEPTNGDPWVKLQAVEGPGGVHLDLDTADRACAVARAADAGATTAWTYHDVVVDRSPGGLLLCHTLLDSPLQRQRSGGALLDQVCLDVPAPLWEREVAFWETLLGSPARSGRLPQFALIGDPDALPRVLLQRLDSGDGPVRAHPDLAVSDRASETSRHLGLGAEVETVTPLWTVLRAPYGQRYCLTDRDPITGSLAS